MRLTEVFGVAKNLGKFRRNFPVNRCYVVSLQGERGSDSDRQYDAGRRR